MTSKSSHATRDRRSRRHSQSQDRKERRRHSHNHRRRSSSSSSSISRRRTSRDKRNTTRSKRKKRSRSQSRHRKDKRHRERSRSCTLRKSKTEITVPDSKTEKEEDEKAVRASDKVKAEIGRSKEMDVSVEYKKEISVVISSKSPVMELAQDTETEIVRKVSQEVDTNVVIMSSKTASAPKSTLDVTLLKRDILNALEEARSAIAGIRGDSHPQIDLKKSESESRTSDINAERITESKPGDDFDMFSLHNEPDTPQSVPCAIASIENPACSCDDREGYYQATIGEVLNGRYRVLGTIGKGVFSTVLRCHDSSNSIAPFNNDLSVVAVKLIRNNDTMRNASQMEVKILNLLAERDPRDKRHCVRLLDTFEHRNHISLVFEPMQMNLREAMKKFGGKSGISIQAVRVFTKHLLIALGHLEACGVVHADIKPDNILLDEKQTNVKLCDFGSAFLQTDGTRHDLTPYLVSRFYRAPEIILGFSYDKAVDMWSIGCCLFEMFTGKVLFPGSTNNEMLKLFMQVKEKLPTRVIKRHRSVYLEQFQMEPHFTEDMKFISRECDRVTGKPITRYLERVKKSFDLGSALMAVRTSTDKREHVKELQNLLENMLALDPAKRISVHDALAHPFVKR